MVFVLTSYREALDYLFARTTGEWKLGLERTEALLAALGNPHRQYPSFHVGGTNGKGSVVATLDSLLRDQGMRVGRYTSPHLIDFRERILVNGRPIGEEEVVAFIERWMPEIERLGATFFEATTCLAFEHFAHAAVDVAVIEVGLGGRLDATNVITPLVAGVTSIGIDHTQYLGSTVPDIAREKAGIFKRSVPAAIGEQDLVVQRQLAVLAERAGAHPVRRAAGPDAVRDIAISASGTSFTLRLGSLDARVETSLVGRHQAYNTSLGLTMLQLAGSPFTPAIAGGPPRRIEVELAGRFHRAMEGRVIFDVAHNPDGATVLADTLEAVAVPRPRSALLAILADKDWKGVMSRLAPVVDAVVLSRAPSVPESRAWNLEEAALHAARFPWSVLAEPDFDRALERALEGGATTLITGSFHTVGDAMLRLQVSPLAG